MTRQALFLKNECTCQYMIDLKIVLKAVIRKKPTLNSDWGNVITTAKIQSNTLLSSSIKGAIGSTLKSSLIWGAPLSLAGDFLECGIDTYHSKRNGICATPEKFKANVSLNAVKTVASGVAAGAGGYSSGLIMTSFIAGVAETFELTALGASAGPVGALAGFSMGVYASYQGGKVIDSIYKKHNSHSQMTRFLEGR